MSFWKDVIRIFEETNIGEVFVAVSLFSFPSCVHVILIIFLVFFPTSFSFFPGSYLGSKFD